jgi:hypothetical protein
MWLTVAQASCIASKGMPFGALLTFAEGKQWNEAILTGDASLVESLASRE